MTWGMTVWMEPGRGQLVPSSVRTLVIGAGRHDGATLWCSAYRAGAAVRLAYRAMGRKGDARITANGDLGLREVAASRHLVCGEHLDQKVGGSGCHAVELLLAAGAEDFAEDVMVHLGEIENGQSVRNGRTADLVASIKRSLILVRQVSQKGGSVVAV